jgi:large subunit ribosomal protein L3
MRSGLIAEKLGSSSLYLEDGRKVQVTLLKMEECEVVGAKTLESDGYNSVVLGYGAVKKSRVNKPQREAFAKLKIEPKRVLKESRVEDLTSMSVGTKVNVDHFSEGQFVDAMATSKGKGFSGVMKRHNFRGLEASHGVSISHRSHGSIGQCQDPGKVFKGKKMAGQYGNVRKTILNLQVMQVQAENRIIVVKGSVPGPKGGLVFLRDSVKK